MKKPKISVIGLGFVGLCLAIVNANKGFETVGIDIDTDKLNNLKKGEPYFYEPNLRNYLKKALKKKIIFTNNFSGILQTDITFLTVGTPSKPNGEIDLSQLKKVISKLSKLLKKKKSKHLIVIKSTVVPSTTSKVVFPTFKKLRNVGIVVNPEFLREGSVFNDLLDPHLIVIGSLRKNDADLLEKYYRFFYKILPETIKTDPTTAEMIKYSNNAFLATKISFINSIANICQNLPMVDVNKIAYAIGKDPRIGNQFLKAGPGFGGSCLPKDLSALINFSSKMGNINNLLSSVKNVNDHQYLQIVEIMKQMKIFKTGKTIAVLGLSFKKNTDDIREAVSVKLVNFLIKNGLRVNVHDPLAIENFRLLFRNKINYFDQIQECFKNTDCCVLLTEWDDYAKLSPVDFKIKMKNPNIIDARRILKPEKFSKLNYFALGLGKNG